MLLYEQFIESREELYHILDVDNLNYVLDNDKISSYKAGNGKISTTRDFKLNSYLGDNVTSIFKIVLDRKKLEKDYEIKSFVYRSKTGINFDEEQEEQIQTREIVNIWKYVKYILLIKSRVEKMKTDVYGEVSNWFNSIGGRGGNIPTILKDIKKKIDSKNIPLYIQSGSEVVKDGKYIDSIINYPLETIPEKWFIGYRARVEDKSKKFISSFATREILTDSSYKEISDFVVSRIEIDIDKYDLNIFNDLKDVKKNINKFSKTIEVDEIEYIPYLIKIEYRKNKWYTSNFEKADWIYSKLKNL